MHILYPYPPPYPNYAESSAGGGPSSSSSSSSKSSTSTSSSSSSSTNLLNGTNVENQRVSTQAAIENTSSPSNPTAVNSQQLAQDARLVANKNIGNYIAPNEETPQLNNNPTELHVKSKNNTVFIKKIAKITDSTISNASNPVWNENNNAKLVNNSINDNTIAEHSYSIENTADDDPQYSLNNQNKAIQDQTNQNTSDVEKGAKKDCNVNECEMENKMLKCIDCILFGKNKEKDNTDDAKNQTSETKKENLKNKSNTIDHDTSLEKPINRHHYFLTNTSNLILSDRLNKSMATNILEDAERSDNDIKFIKRPEAVENSLSEKVTAQPKFKANRTSDVKKEAEGTVFFSGQYVSSH